MNPNHASSAKHHMTIRLSRLAAGGALVAAAALTTAAPAMAQEYPEPGGESIEQTLPPEPSTSAVDVSSATLGALGGIALGGAGLWITLGIQRRRDHSAAHPT